MKKIYFVRHGQTTWNVENKICGATDIPLTDFGHEQAVQTAHKLLEQGITADEILYSPLIRAKDTAMHISEITGIPASDTNAMFFPVCSSARSWVSRCTLLYSW